MHVNLDCAGHGGHARICQQTTRKLSFDALVLQHTLHLDESMCWLCFLSFLTRLRCDREEIPPDICYLSGDMTLQ